MKMKSIKLKSKLTLLSKPIRFDVFSPPTIYPVSVLLFLLVSIGELTSISLLLFMAYLISFILGCLVVKSGKNRAYPWIRQAGLPFMLVGFASELLNLYFAGGVPLFNPELRSKFFSSLTYLSFLIVPGTVILFEKNITRKRKTAFLWFLTGLILISLTGYKTEVFALILSTIFTFYYLEPEKGGKLVYFLLPGLLIFFNVFMILRGGGFLGQSLLRFPLATSIFSMIVSNLGLSLTGFTGGTLTQSIFSSLDIIPGPMWGPRGHVSYLVGMGEGVTTTSTILGIPYIDFGLVGIATLGFVLGLLFNRGYRCLKAGSKDILPFHALCLSFLLITIETGIGDAIVIAYFMVYAAMIL